MHLYYKIEKKNSPKTDLLFQVYAVIFLHLFKFGLQSLDLFFLTSQSTV